MNEDTKYVFSGHFERSCKNCHLTGANATILSCSCQMFGKNAPYQDTEVDLGEPHNIYLSCGVGFAANY